MISQEVSASAASMHHDALPQPVSCTDPGAPLRIVMVSMHTSPTAPPGTADAGGMNVVELNAAIALGAAGHHVDLLTRKDEAHLPQVVDLGPGVRMFNLDAGPAVPVAKSHQETLIEPFRDAMSRWWRANGAGVDVVHSHHWFSGVAALPVARRAGVPHVQSYHSVAAPEGAGLDAGEPPESLGRRDGERLAARQSDRIVAVSDYEARTIVQRYRPPVDRIRIVHPGVDLQQFRPLAPGEAHWAWRGDYLLLAARLEPLKAPDLALRTLAELPPGDRPRLVVAGQAAAEFSWYAHELRELATQLGITDRVLYIGSQDRDQLATMMRGARILLNPSRSETFGLVNLEASASGVPVVASRAGGMAESVMDNTTGLLMDSRDPVAWARAVRILIRDAGRWASMGHAGRAFAQTRGWPVVAGEFAAVYREVARR